MNRLEQQQQHAMRRARKRRRGELYRSLALSLGGISVGIILWLVFLSGLLY
jgi:hypothetical protein